MFVGVHVRYVQRGAVSCVLLVAWCTLCAGVCRRVTDKVPAGSCQLAVAAGRTQDAGRAVLGVVAWWARAAAVTVHCVEARAGATVARQAVVEKRVSAVVAGSVAGSVRARWAGAEDGVRADGVQSAQRRRSGECRWQWRQTTDAVSGQ